MTRARASGAPAVFWLDETRAHDANLIGLVNTYLADHDIDRARHPDPRPARGRVRVLDRAHPQRCEDTSSVTGNVLRDYNTDLFPILELGTSCQDAVGRLAHERRRAVRDRGRRLRAQARPAAGEGELPALGQPRRVPRARGVFEHSPRTATLAPRCWPTRSTGPPARSCRRTGRRPARSARSTTAASHFYLALYWAQELAEQTDDADLAAAFEPLAEDAARRTSRSSPTS